MRPTKNRHFCIGCQKPKMLFVTQEKADNFMRFNNIAMASNHQKTPSRSYYCSFCCGWHITSVSDDKFAKSRDEKDSRLWATIKTAPNNKVKRAKAALSKSLESQKSKKEKPIPSEFELQRDAMVQEISQNLHKVSVLLNQTDYETSRSLIEASEIIYHNVVKLVEEHQIPPHGLAANKKKLDRLSLWLYSLVSLQHDTDRQTELIKELEGDRENKTYRNSIKTLKTKEKIINYEEALKAALETDNEEEVQNCLRGIAMEANLGFGGAGCCVNRKWARQRLTLAKKLVENKNPKKYKTIG